MADTGTGYTPWNIELATSQADIDRRRQMLAALLMQSMQRPGTQMAGNIAIRNSPLSAVGNLLQGYVAQKGINNLSDEEKALIEKTQKQSADAVTGIMGASKYQQGTPTTINEEAGPPTADGTPSMSVVKGKPGGMDDAGFAKAYAAAQGKVDPKLLADMLQQFSRNKMLLGNPETAQFVPGFAGSQGQPTQGTNSQGGVSLSIPAGSPSGGASSGGGLYGVPGVAAGLTLSGDPALEKLGTMVGKYAEPQNLREGGSLTALGPDGKPTIALTAPKLPEGTRMVNGQIEPIPGYMGTKGAILDKEAAIKAGYQPVKMENSDGSTTQGYLMPGGVFKPFTSGTSAVQTAPGTPASPSVMGMQTAPLTPQQQAMQDRDNGVAPAVTTGRSQPTMQKYESETLGKNLGDQALKVDDNATAAQVVKSRTTEMRPLLDMFNPNLAGPVRLKIGEGLLAAGFSKETADKWAGGDIGAQQAFGKQAIQMAFDATKQLTNRPAAAEVLLQIKANPNIGMTKPAMTAILDYTDGIANWHTEKQQFKDKWVESKGTYSGFEGWWNRTHPVDNYVPSADQLRTVLAGDKAAAPTTGLGSRQVAGGIGSGAPNTANKMVMRFDAQGNLVQ